MRLPARKEPDAPADNQDLVVLPKAQTIFPNLPGTICALLLKQIKATSMHPQFQSNVVRLMNIANTLDQEVKTLSSTALQSTHGRSAGSKGVQRERLSH